MSGHYFLAISLPVYGQKKLISIRAVFKGQLFYKKGNFPMNVDISSHNATSSSSDLEILSCVIAVCGEMPYYAMTGSLITAAIAIVAPFLRPIFGDLIDLIFVIPGRIKVSLSKSFKWDKLSYIFFFSFHFSSPYAPFRTK